MKQALMLASWSLFHAGVFALIASDPITQRRPTPRRYCLAFALAFFSMSIYILSFIS